MVDIAKNRVANEGRGAIVGTQNTTGFGMDKLLSVSNALKAPDLGETNKSILKELGIDLDTILTPKGKRKKKAGLVGGDATELANTLGE